MAGSLASRLEQRLEACQTAIFPLPELERKRDGDSTPESDEHQKPIQLEPLPAHTDVSEHAQPKESTLLEDLPKLAEEDVSTAVPPQSQTSPHASQRSQDHVERSAKTWRGNE